ncbi:transposase [Marinifilum sp. RC60d5]|uniref:transposase n=1 Tax=Marinifilum sp. RC60d5 TaxID=3458414 RepID=UPI004036D163
MANPQLPLEPDQFYHIYNRGINSCSIFKETSNYEHFLRLYDKYISPVAKTFAWVLMGNHFHLLVYITKPEGLEDLRPLDINKRINQQFSNLFNAYTKAFNKRYNRTGSLFEHSFRRKIIDSKDYLRQVVLYIHNNPVHHNFCDHPIEYPWSSYLTCISVQTTKLNRDAVIGWFDNQANFKLKHNQKLDIAKIEQWLDL